MNDTIVEIWIFFLIFGTILTVIQFIYLYKQHNNNFVLRFISAIIFVSISVYISLNIPKIFFEIPTEIYETIQKQPKNKTDINDIVEITNWIENDTDRIVTAINILTRKYYFQYLLAKIIITETSLTMIIVLILSRPKNEQKKTSPAAEPVNSGSNGSQ
jgi:hypothetical protein